MVAVVQVATICARERASASVIRRRQLGVEFRRQPVGERGRASRRDVEQEHTPDRPDRDQRAHVRLALCAAADDDRRVRVGSRQQTRGQRRHGRGPEAGDRDGVHHGQRRARFRVGERQQTLDRRPTGPLLVARQVDVGLGGDDGAVGEPEAGSLDVERPAGEREPERPRPDRVATLV
ncbi:MAG: hypothetical protein R2752_13060 [Vicinamibacterales bacterium]